MQRTRTLPDGEPQAGPLRVVHRAELASLLLDAAGDPVGRPRIVAIDGRGASGKSTLATQLAAQFGSCAVVHTDDLAWHEPLFAWGDLLAELVLRPLQQGHALDVRPPQWEQRSRAGSIVVPAGLDVVLIEGTGASHREHAGLIDATVWVQADFAEAERRGIARDIAAGVNGDEAQTIAFWHEWMAEELRFFARQQPWHRACVVVNGTPQHDLATDHHEVADPPGGCYQRSVART